MACQTKNYATVRTIIWTTRRFVRVVKQGGFQKRIYRVRTRVVIIACLVWTAIRSRRSVPAEISNAFIAAATGSAVPKTVVAFAIRGTLGRIVKYLANGTRSDVSVGTTVCV